MDVESDLAVGKRRLEDQGGEFTFSRFKRFNAEENISTGDSSSEENIEDAFSYISELFNNEDFDALPEKSQFSDMNIDFYTESTPLSPEGHLDEFLNRLLTESEPEGLFRVPENVSRVPDVLNASSFTVSRSKKLYSGPTLKDVKSALSSYGGEDQNGSTTVSSTITASNSGSLFNSLSFESPQLPDSGSSRGFDRSYASSAGQLLYRRLYRSKSEAKYSLKIKCPGNSIDDGYKWRKYGQKAIKNSPYPRSYYRCTNPRCSAKKQVEKCVDDPDTITITYEGLHLHYSYSHFHISNQQHPPNYSNIYDKDNNNNNNRVLIDNGFNGRFDRQTNDAIQASHSPTMVGVHQSQQLLHPQPEQLHKDKYYDFLGFREGYFEEHNLGVNGVVEEDGGGSGDGLLQDIVPLVIRNPLCCSSTTTSSSSSSSP